MLIQKIKNKSHKTIIHQKTKQEIVRAWESLNQPKSVIFYTTHKCASVFISKLLITLTQNSQYEVKDYASAIRDLGDQINVENPYENFLEQASDQLYQTKGKIYAPQRKLLDFPGRENFKHIFFLRDPRDVIVSAYYSFGYSHGIPKATKQQEKQRKQRQKIQQQGIDNYAKESAIGWLNLYMKYRELLESSDSYLYLSYDEFKDNTLEFINKIVSFLEINISDQEAKKLAKEASPISEQKDITKHKRSGKSQQYKEELKPETINYLNETFSEILDYWQFQI